MFVHTGLFKVLQNEDTLAAVLFHEAAHGIARMFRIDTVQWNKKTDRLNHHLAVFEQAMAPRRSR